MLKVKLICLFILLQVCVLFSQNKDIHFGAEVELTKVGQKFIQPVWSPDNQQIALTGANYQGIWLMTSEGQNLRQISGDMAAGYGFSWSLDSQEILMRTVTYEKKRRRYYIKVQNIVSKESRTIAEFRKGPVSIPEWSADNTRIWVTNSDDLKLFATNKSAPESSSFKTSKNLYNTGTELMIYNAAFDLISRERPVNGSYLNAVLSPDGSKVAFEVLGGNMFVCNSDGSNPLDLGKGERPDWAPDSNWLAYMISEDNGHQILNSDIWIIKADGTGKQNVTGSTERIEMNPDWSQDGKSIVYNDRTTGQILKITR